MTAVPDTGLAGTIPEAGRPVRPKRSVLGVSVGVGTYGILVASPLCGPFGHDGGSTGVLAGA
jgi:hypothetical protein